MNERDESTRLAGTAPYNREPRTYDWQRRPEDRIDHDQGSSFDEVMVKFATDITAITLELERLMISKQLDYGPRNISDSPGGAMNGLIVRMNDKMQRLINLHYSDSKPSNESVEDTFMDLANYGIIGLMVLRGRWPQ